MTKKQRYETVGSTVGIDLGGTKILATVVDAQGEIVAEAKQKTRAKEGPDAVIERSVVGPHANVGPGAVIRNAIVCNSIVEANASVEDVVLEGSLIGENAQVKGQPTRLHIGNSAAVGFEYKTGELWYNA